MNISNWEELNHLVMQISLSTNSETNFVRKSQPLSLKLVNNMFSDLLGTAVSNLNRNINQTQSENEQIVVLIIS